MHNHMRRPRLHALDGRERPAGRERPVDIVRRELRHEPRRLPCEEAATSGLRRRDPAGRGGPTEDAAGVESPLEEGEEEVGEEEEAEDEDESEPDEPEDESEPEEWISDASISDPEMAFELHTHPQHIRVLIYLSATSSRCRSRSGG